MKKITMYMVTHKAVDYIPKGRTPIFVGGRRDGYLSDCTEINISDKNKYFCELTALYWIWKNDKDSDYISIEHYRRFFLDRWLLEPISQRKILKMLEKYDMLETVDYSYCPSVYAYYSKAHFEDDLSVIRSIISEKHPEYLASYDEVMNGNRAAQCNMIVMKKEQFDQYCEWLFSILFECEERIDYKSRDAYQQRVFGFLSERLQNVWIRENGKNVGRLPIYMLASNIFESKFISLKQYVKCVVKNRG